MNKTTACINVHPEQQKQIPEQKDGLRIGQKGVFWPNTNDFVFETTQGRHCLHVVHIKYPMAKSAIATSQPGT